MEYIEIENGKEGFAKYGKSEKVIAFIHNDELNSKKQIEELKQIEEENLIILDFNVKHKENLIFAKSLRVTALPTMFFLKKGSPKSAIVGLREKEVIIKKIKTVFKNKRK